MQQQCARVVVRFRESHLFIITFQHYYLSTLAPGYNICLQLQVFEAHVCIGCLRQLVGTSTCHRWRVDSCWPHFATEYVNIAYLIF